MSLSDEVLNWSWWSSPQWRKYCEAYDGTDAHRPLSEPSYVVDLSGEIKPARGHRYRIRQQMECQHIRTVSTVEPLHRAHVEAAGRETRSTATWDLMEDWIHDWQAVCVTNGEGGWAYVIVDHPGAYWASAAGRDTHYLQWKLIGGLREAGFSFYELGMGHTPGIRTFKAGFSNAVIEP